MRPFPQLISPIVVTGLALLCVASARADEWLLTYAVSEEQQIGSPDGKTPPENKTRSYQQVVALAENYLVAQDDRQKLIRDFMNRRYRVVDSSTQTYEEWSLFAFVDFLEAELANRNALGAGMRAAKVEPMAAQFTRFDNETALRLESLPHPRNPAEPIIEEAIVENGVELRHDERIVARFTLSHTSLPSHLQHRFANYVAHTWAIHPKIRRAILASGKIPQELRFTVRDVNKITTTTLRLLSAKVSTTDSSVLPPNVAPASHRDDPIFQLLADIRRAEQTERRTSREEMLDFAESSIDAKRPLDAYMALLEYHLQTGEPITEELRRYRKRFESDSVCRTYRRAFDQSSKAACEASLAANASLDRSGLIHAHMLELQRANLLERLGKPSEAKDNFIVVLRANPFHAGALHDLGMLLARSWEHPKAWLCWDTARRLYPEHFMLKSITQREQQLLSRYPDFF